MSQITQQKGASSSTPSAFMRWALSKVMNYVGSEQYQNKIRKKREAKRQKEGRKHVVEYFHQVDDGYSHLCIQILSKLRGQYDIELVIHLVPPLRDDNFPEPDLWQQMSLNDAAQVAPYYGLEFTGATSLPSETLLARATALLCKLDSQQFAAVGAEISACVWRNDEAGLSDIADRVGVATADQVCARLQAGTARRAALKHYGSAMFYYEGEWYWGVDRLYHLEERLNELGAKKSGEQALVLPRPECPTDFPDDAKKLTLEFFVSLRSPYTAIAWDPTLKLAEASGVNLVVRPVLPMVMRGVPATREKKFYIVKDVGREARASKVEYGNFYDPIGKPVLQGYSLYMWACKQNKGNALLSAFLKAAFAKGINTNSTKGLQQVVESAGLNWNEAKNHLEDDTWQDLLEKNRLAMYKFGSWGVPSYRLLDAYGNDVLNVWGQDRLWLVGHKIKELTLSAG